MNLSELNLDKEFICEIESVKKKYKQIMFFIETKDIKVKKDLIDFSNSLDFREYRDFRDAISDMWRKLSWKKKFACYELSAALMNERPKIFV